MCSLEVRYRVMRSRGNRCCAPGAAAVWGRNKRSIYTGARERERGNERGLGSEARALFDSQVDGKDQRNSSSSSRRRRRRRCLPPLHSATTTTTVLDLYKSKRATASAPQPPPLNKASFDR